MRNLIQAAKIIEETYNNYVNYGQSFLLKDRYIPKKDPNKDQILVKNYGLILDSKKLFWIRIPKCGNSFVRSHLENIMNPIDLQKDYVKITGENDYRGFAIIRDPFERWLTGACTLLRTYDGSLAIQGMKLPYFENNLDELERTISKNKYLQHILIEFLISKLLTDYHGLLQSWYLYPSNIEKLDLFYMNDKLGYQLNHYLRSMGIANQFNNKKIGSRLSNDIFYDCLTEFFFDYANVKYKNKIMEILKPDYDLLNTISFYNR